MEDVQLKSDAKGFGLFYIEDGQQQLAQMEVVISGNDLTVNHTEVSPKAEGKGLAKILLANMVEYAKRNHLKVIFLCPFVYAQFKRHPEQYDEVYNNKD